jgi:hypothetical protein
MGRDFEITSRLVLNLVKSAFSPATAETPRHEKPFAWPCVRHLRSAGGKPTNSAIPLIGHVERMWFLCEACGGYFPSPMLAVCSRPQSCDKTCPKCGMLGPTPCAVRNCGMLSTQSSVRRVEIDGVIIEGPEA